MTTTLYAHVLHCTLYPDFPRVWEQTLQILEGADVEIRIAKTAGRKRTMPQNSLYWLRNQHLTLGPCQGWSKGEIHEYLMETVGYIETRDSQVIGQRTVRRSSTTLDVEEFSRLMEEQDRIALSWNELMPDAAIELPSGETS